MHINPAKFAITIAFSIILTGCLGKVKYPTYYTLRLSPATVTPAIKPTTASIAIREFRSPEYLHRGAIVYRPSEEEIGFYEYHRWATEPPKTVTESVLDYLRARGDFTQVTIYDGRSDADYLLSGRLEKLDEVDYYGRVKVEVALSAQLTDIHTGKTVWENSASETAPVEGGDVRSVVASMSQAMNRTIAKLLSTLPAGSATANGY